MYAYKDGDKLVEEGLKMGADCVGAIPHFELAREFGEKNQSTRQSNWLSNIISLSMYIVMRQTIRRAAFWSC